MEAMTKNYKIIDVDYYNFSEYVKELSNIEIWMNKKHNIEYNPLEKQIIISKNIKKYSDKILQYLLENSIRFIIEYYGDSIKIQLLDIHIYYNIIQVDLIEFLESLRDL